MIGAYALNNTMQSVYVLLLFGIVGCVLVKFGFPLAPLILGLILGDQIEINLVRAIMTDSDPWLFVTRPISGGLLAAARVYDDTTKIPLPPGDLSEVTTCCSASTPRRRCRRSAARAN